MFNVVDYSDDMLFGIVISLTFVWAVIVLMTECVLLLLVMQCENFVWSLWLKSLISKCNNVLLVLMFFIFDLLYDLMVHFFFWILDGIWLLNANSFNIVLILDTLILRSIDMRQI